MNMHVDEKSDSVIVPKKPSNKEGLPSAEAVEERTLPEGNNQRTTVVRTQSRVATSSGLLTVRRVGKHGVDTKCLVRPHRVQ